jgi:hypothetical protein
MSKSPWEKMRDYFTFWRTAALVTLLGAGLVFIHYKKALPIFMVSGIHCPHYNAQGFES